MKILDTYTKQFLFTGAIHIQVPEEPITFFSLYSTDEHQAEYTPFAPEYIHQLTRKVLNALYSAYKITVIKTNLVVTVTKLRYNYLITVGVVDCNNVYETMYEEVAALSPSCITYINHMHDKQKTNVK